MLDPNGFNELKACRIGPLVFNKNDWPIGTSLKIYGEFSWSEVEIFNQSIRPGQVVVDAGANIGVHTVRMSQLVGPSGQVFAFEPQRIAFQTLCANAALNNCTNVHAFQAALGNRNGMITVPVLDQYKPGNFGGVPLAGITEGEQVTLAPLDALELSACHFIKADLEGMEAEFLDGARGTITKHRPILYIEGDGAEAKQSIEMLFEWGYKCFWHIAPLFNQDNFAGQELHVFMQGKDCDISSVNILCLPRESKITTTGFLEIISPDEDGMRMYNELRIRRRKEKEAAVG